MKNTKCLWIRSDIPLDQVAELLVEDDLLTDDDLVGLVLDVLNLVSNQTGDIELAYTLQGELQKWIAEHQYLGAADRKD